jgi:uncharacterized membrane protein YjgN (DUF898 family)
MESLRFTGSGSEYFKIWIVNILLTIVTLGLYYPWAKVRNKRYFYANSTLADRNFEYHATGKQLFIGFLIAVGIFILFQVLSNVSPDFALILMVLLFLAIPWIIWRSLIFNMRVTSFSNVFFAFKGKLGTAYINYFGLPLLFIIAFYGLPVGVAVIMPLMLMGTMGGGEPSTFQMLLPILIVVVSIISLIVAFYLIALIKKRNTEYVLNGTRYGQGVFESKLETKKFMWINLKVFGLTLLAMIALFGLALALGINVEELASINPEELEEGLSAGLLGMLALTYVGLLFFMLLIMAFLITRQRTYIFENTMLDGKIGFKSTLRARDFAWVMVSNILLIIITLGFAIPWAKVRMARLTLENTHVDTSVGFDEYLSQKEQEQSSLGDQLGDAFDVDVGVGI